MAEMISDYLNQFQAALPLSMGKRLRSRLIYEIEDHLLASLEAEQACGRQNEDTQRLILERFGSPFALAQEFAQQDALHKRKSIRFCLFVGLTIFLVFLIYSLLRYPAIGGTSIMLVVESLLSAGVVGLYWWFGLQGTHNVTPTEMRGPWLGMKASLIFGVLLVGVSVVSTLLDSLLWSVGNKLFPQPSLLGLDSAINTYSYCLPLLVWLGATAWYSVAAARETGRIDIGTRTGLWSGLMAGLLMGLVSILEYYFFLDLTLHTSWPHDTICLGSHNLASCEMNDLLGGIAFMVLLLPCIGTVLGMISAFIGRNSQIEVQHTSCQAEQVSLTFSRQQAIIGSPVGSSLIFCCLTLAIYLVGIVIHLM